MRSAVAERGADLREQPGFRRVDRLASQARELGQEGRLIVIELVGNFDVDLDEQVAPTPTV